jgi:hypothetical protein
MTLPENKNVLSLASHKWLREAGEFAPPHCLHLLTLASWGLQNGVEGEWPSGDRLALDFCGGSTCGAHSHALSWLDELRRQSSDAIGGRADMPRAPAPHQSGSTDPERPFDEQSCRTA